MSFAEKILPCIDCKKTFIYTVEEQQRHASHGYVNVPLRCPPCRKAKRLKQSGSDSDGWSSLQSGKYFR